MRPTATVRTGARVGGGNALTSTQRATAVPVIIGGGAEARQSAPAPADEPATEASNRAPATNGTAFPQPGLTTRPSGRDADTEHRRKYRYGEDADELFLGGLPEGASSVVDADPAGVE